MLPLVAPDGNYCTQTEGISQELESAVPVPYVGRVVDLMGWDSEPSPGMPRRVLDAIAQNGPCLALK